MGIWMNINTRLSCLGRFKSGLHFGCQEFLHKQTPWSLLHFIPQEAGYVGEYSLKQGGFMLFLKG